MSSIEERRRTAYAGVEDEAWADGFARPRVFLQPIAAPSILGLAGFAGATFMVATLQAKWWGTATDLRIVAPFAAFYGGLAQFTAGMWAYKARDGVATLAHGTWGAFWLAFGTLFLLQAGGVIPTPAPTAPQIGFGLWFIALAFTTWPAAFGALVKNIGLFAVLSTLATGSALTAAGLMTGGWNSGWTSAGGWLFTFSAGFAVYTVLSMVLHSATGRTILPMGEWKASANIPGGKPQRAVELEWAEPGIKKGQ